MLKGFLATAAAVTAALAFTACSSIEIGTTVNGEKLTDLDTAQSRGVVNADLWGVYLFNLPLFTGSNAQTGRCAIFKDTITVDGGINVLTREAKSKLEATKVVDVVSTRSNVWVFPTLIFWYRSVQVSGTALR